MEMLRKLCLLMTLSALHEATPLVGQDVRMAYLGEFPFVVSISQNNPANLNVPELNHICGGSLITRKHVLTAAHCLIDHQYDQLVVRVGSVDLRNAESYQVEWWSIYSSWAAVPVPPKYDAYNIYDIAVIKLKSAVSSDIELPILSYMNATLLYEREAVTAGWGRLEKNVKPRYLRTARFSVMHPENCEVFTYEKKPFLSELRPKIFLCTRAAQIAQMACGDSGSPLLSRENHYHLLAINKNGCIPKNDTSLSAIRNLHSFVNFYAEFIETMKNK